MRDAESDGIFLQESARAVRDNRVVRSGSDGIENLGHENRIKKNVANDNFDYGIESIVERLRQEQHRERERQPGAVHPGYRL